MSDAFRGGNSRLLAKQLDQLAWPVVVLDQRSEIVFVNAAVCDAVGADAVKLVGLSCSAALPEDGAEFPAFTMMLAPPAAVHFGKAVLRRVPWPPLSPAAVETSQLFLPIIDEDPSQGLVLVLLGDPANLRRRLEELPGQSSKNSSTAPDELLIRLRNQWQQLDGLSPLVGSSAQATLAMQRAQMALLAHVGVWIHGPRGCGKAEVARAIAVGRAKHLNLPVSVEQIQCIDCSMVDILSAAAALEMLTARMRPGAPAAAHHLILENLDQADGELLSLLDAWIAKNRGVACVIATSLSSPRDWSDTREEVLRATSISIAHKRLIGALSVIEIELAPLESRREDIGPLFQNALAAAAQRAGRRLPTISSAAAESLAAYPWPENLTEIQAAAVDTLNSAVLTAAIQPQHLPLAVRTFGSSLAGGSSVAVEPIQLDEVLLQLERVLIDRALKLSPRNRARAARLLGISRPRLLRRISQLGLAAAEPEVAGEKDGDEEE
ncbi:MAG: helix-turn-helix domain-containing protein [Pirellulales bacterium]